MDPYNDTIDIHEDSGRYLQEYISSNFKWKVLSLFNNLFSCY